MPTYFALITVLAALLYLVATANVFAYLKPNGAPRYRRSTFLWCTLGAITAHALSLAAAAFYADGLRLDVYIAASSILWLVALLFAIGIAYRNLAALGVLVLPIAAMTTLLPWLWSGHAPERATPPFLIQLHGGVSALAYAVLALAAFQSLVLHWQEHYLMRHRSDRLLARLPPLIAQEKWLFHFIAIGFFLLTLSLISGLVFVDDLLAQHLAHKTILSIIAWGLFGFLLWGRIQLGWRGSTAVRWCLSGALVLLLAYFGSKLILEEILGRHWGI